MIFFNKQFLSWLLVLIIAISPIQVTTANGFGQSSHGELCQMIEQEKSVNSTVKATEMTADCGMSHGNDCQQHLGCIAQFSSTLIFLSLSSVSINRAVTHLKFIAGNDSILTHYPSRLKRPPRV